MNISVIIPVYNAEKYLENAVQSALQFDEVKEVILIEDGSPDNALAICKKLVKKEDRVHLYQHENGVNKGAGASRNLGIEKASQDFIAFLDADDYYLPNRFDAEKELFKNPEVEGVYGAIGVDYYSEKAKEQYFSIYGNKLDTIYEPCHPSEVFPGQMFLRGSFGLIHLDTLTLRRKALKKMNAYFNSHLRLHQDTDFTIRAAYYLKLYSGILDTAIAMRGVHESNRITAVETKQIKPASTKELLWKSLSKWANEEESMPKDFRKHIERMYASFQIANAGFPKNYLKFINAFFNNTELVKSGLYRRNYKQVLFPFL